MFKMASHGRRGVQGLLLGSETQKVLTHSRFPCWCTVEADSNQKEVNMFKHILLPTDGSKSIAGRNSKRGPVAKSMKAKITGISVMPEQKYYLYQTDIIVQVKEETIKHHKLQANRNLSVIEKAAQDAGVPCETLCEINDHPYETIIKIAEKRGCDLIMMASHGQRGVKGLLLGSETRKC